MESMVRLNELDQYYKGKKVFLTGHTGFKGTWLTAWLHQLGAIVKGYSLAPDSQNSIYLQINGDSLCESVIADIRDAEKLKKEILDFQPDFIFHLAAQPLVRKSFEVPIETYAVNVMGTGHVLEAVRFLDKPCIVVLITTDKVYENKEWIYPYRETDRLGGYDPYSSSKAACEILVSSFRNSFFNPEKYSNHQKSIATVRAGNVIGGGDWAEDRIIPDLVRALAKKENLMVRNPFAVRPWQHVMEPLGGYLTLGAYMSIGPEHFAEAFNFGPEAEGAIPVKELIDYAIKIWGSGSYHSPELLDQPHEANLLKLDCSKANSKLHWKPKLNVEETISTTLYWYKNFFTNPELSRDLTFQQIQDYIQLPNK